jgi:phosphoserine phosphatase RsbU/P
VIRSRGLVAERDVSAELSAESLSAKILIVDDQEINIEFMSIILGDAGFYNIRSATDGLAALQLLEEERPDILILDVLMPIMSGIDLCRQLRCMPEYSELPILVQTGLDTVHDRIEIIRAGASCILPKPLNGPELVQHVVQHVDRKRLIYDMRRTHERLTKELGAAQDMQLGLLPTRQQLRKVSEPLGLEVASTFITSSELGGDIWGVFPVGADRVAFFIVDFAGHGVMAALNTFRLHTMIEELYEPPDDPGALLSLLGARLKPLLPIGQFATMTCVYIDTRAETITWSSAGSPSPVLVDPRGEVRPLDSAGLPLGILASPEYKNQIAPFPPGAQLLLYSDALVETVMISGSRLEEHGLLQIVKRTVADWSAQVSLDNMIEEFRDLHFGQIQDDLTCIVIRNAKGVRSLDDLSPSAL